MNILKEEPVASTGALTVVVNALIALAIGFEWIDWDTTEIALVVGLWNAVVAMVLTLVVRRGVTPQAHLLPVDVAPVHPDPDPPGGV